MCVCVCVCERYVCASVYMCCVSVYLQCTCTCMHAYSNVDTICVYSKLQVIIGTHTVMADGGLVVDYARPSPQTTYMYFL